MIAFVLFLASFPLIAILAWRLQEYAHARRIAREIPTCYGYGKLCGKCRACHRMPGDTVRVSDTVQDSPIPSLNATRNIRIH